MSTSKRTRILAAVLAAAMPFAGPGALAATKAANFDVTMRVVADCTIGAATLNFGQTGVITNTISATSTIDVTCTNTTPYNVGLDAGTGTGSSGTKRYLSGTSGNADTVEFKLYRAQGSGLWGNTQGTDTMAGTGSGNPQPLTVYGEIEKQKSPAPDNYKSMITATIYF